MKEPKFSASKWTSAHEILSFLFNGEELPKGWKVRMRKGQDGYLQLEMKPLKDSD